MWAVLLVRGSAFRGALLRFGCGRGSGQQVTLYEEYMVANYNDNAKRFVAEDKVAMSTEPFLTTDVHVRGFQWGCYVLFRCPHCVDWRQGREGWVYGKDVYHRTLCPENPNQEVRMPVPCRYLKGWLQFDYVVHLT
mmetsp:Transcript_36533/g.86767  ORF Transcript_36533/g.86767 Transcript_36533/m.86767 type:complete len:136 (+) Transcript_36533:1916-2323(+)